MAEAKASKSVLSVGGIESPILLWKAVGSPPREAAWDLEPVSELLPDPEVESPIRFTAFSDPLADVVRDSNELASTPITGPAKRRRGVVADDGSFVALDEEIAEIAERTKLEAMKVVAFVSNQVIPRSWIVGSYYLGLGEGGDGRVLKALRLGLVDSRSAAVVRWTKSKKQALGVVVPSRGDVLLLLELAWREDVREIPPRAVSFNGAAVSDDEVAAMGGLIGAMRATVDVFDRLRDDARVLRTELLEAAREGRSIDVGSYRDPAELEARTLERES